LPENEEAVMISAEKKWGLPGLLEKISSVIREKAVTTTAGENDAL
jgi:50S ribosomal subunit-associated GTPase HflX